MTMPAILAARQPIRLLRIEPERLVPHAWPELGQARVQRALDLAVAARKQTHRPVGAEDQAVLAKAIRDMIACLREPGAAGESVNTIALSGGCFQNKLLFEEVVRLLESDGLTCLSHAKFPTNDGGLALGQAAMAAARHLENSNQAEVACASCA